MSRSTQVSDQESSQSTGKLPEHVAIMMDGNGRWATARGLPRSLGHEHGVEALRNVIQASVDTGIRYLTVFSFSTENWNRPKGEVDALLKLLRTYVKQDLKQLREKGVRIRVIGKRIDLPKDIFKLVEKVELDTINNDSLFLNIAFNYGGRDEIIRAISRMIEAIHRGELTSEDVTEENFSHYLDTRDIPNPDLVIRTSGEVRVSNFQLWQTAYSEFVFLDVLWPDFNVSHLNEALKIYANRNRRYGAVDKECL